jgi:hypothetical protein
VEFSNAFLSYVGKEKYFLFNLLIDKKCFSSFIITGRVLGKFYSLNIYYLDCAQNRKVPKLIAALQLFTGRRQTYAQLFFAHVGVFPVSCNFQPDRNRERWAAAAAGRTE